MKALLSIPFLIGVLLAMTPNRSFSMLSVGYISKSQAVQFGLKIQMKTAGPDSLWIEIQFRTQGDLKIFGDAKQLTRMELRIGDGAKSLVTVALREDRMQLGFLAVGFSVGRELLENASVWMIQPLGGSARVIRLKDFIELTEAPATGDGSEANRRGHPGERGESGPPASSNRVRSK